MFVHSVWTRAHSYHKINAELLLATFGASFESQSDRKSILLKEGGSTTVKDAEHCNNSNCNSNCNNSNISPGQTQLQPS